MRDETREMAELLFSLSWYENIGRSDIEIVDPPLPYVRCNTLEEAISHAMSDPWKDVRIHNRNNIQSMMIEYSEEYFRELGVNFGFEIEKIAKKIVDEIIYPKFTMLELPERLLLYMMADINGILKEEESSWIGKTGFYTENILYWHKIGLYPCGWIGNKYPNGKMVVY